MASPLHWLLVILIIAFGLVHPKYLSLLNIGNVLAFTPELGIIALGRTLLMTSGEFDLSVGSVFGFSAVIMWILVNEAGIALPIAFFAALAVCMGIGLFSGLFTTRLKIPSFLVTLGMLLVVRGTAQYITSGFPQRVFQTDSTLANILVGEVVIGDLTLRMSLFWFALFAIVLAFVLTMSKYGNWIQASGGNRLSARARGVRVNATKVALFVLTAFLAGWAGITSSIRTLSANPNAGVGFELEVSPWWSSAVRARRWPRHDLGHGARSAHPQIGAQLDALHRCARIGLQHLHRGHHPGHDGAADLARSTPDAGGVR